MKSVRKYGRCNEGHVERLGQRSRNFKSVLDELLQLPRVQLYYQLLGMKIQKKGRRPLFIAEIHCKCTIPNRIEILFHHTRN